MLSTKEIKSHKLEKKKKTRLEKEATVRAERTREVKLDGSIENVSQDEAQSSSQRKRANKHKWMPLQLRRCETRQPGKTWVPEKL